VGPLLPADHMSTAAATPLPPLLETAEPRRFHARMAAACVAVAFLGFAPTYWVPMVRGTLTVDAIAHLHALFFYGWVLLFWRQASAVAAGRMTRHREAGVAGVDLASGMLFVGMGVALDGMRVGDLAGVGASVRAFSIVPVLGILLFATLVGLSVLNVRRPEVHKRLMLVATISILHPAVGRWFTTFLAPRPPIAVPIGAPPASVTVLPGLVTD